MIINKSICLDAYKTYSYNYFGKYKADSHSSSLTILVSSTQPMSICVVLNFLYQSGWKTQCDTSSHPQIITDDRLRLFTVLLAVLALHYTGSLGAAIMAPAGWVEKVFEFIA